MKKLLLSICVGIVTFSASLAQCTPDTTITAVIVPPKGSKVDTTNEKVILPYAYIGQSYSEVIYFKVPADTNLFGNTVTINYVKLEAILGLPTAFTHSCTPSSCQFPGGSYGCAEMDGIPSQIDSVELKVAIEYNITLSGLPTPIKDTLDGYFLVTKAPIGLPEHHLVKPNTPKLFPNPAKDKLFMEFNATNRGNAQLEISSLIGSLVYSHSYSLSSGSNKLEINVANFNPGIYMYSLKTKDKNFTGRFTISH